MASIKLGKIIGYLFLILIGLYFIYAFYETFFLKDPSPYSVISTAFVLIILGGIILIMILEKICVSFPKNKTLKKIAQCFEKTLSKILEALRFY